MEIAVLQVPSGQFGLLCPWIQTTDGRLIASCITALRSSGFADPATRKVVFVNKQALTAEFHQLQGRDPEAGLVILMYLKNSGWKIERADISQAEHGTYVVAVVYTLSKE